ncbi:hypothetical protein ACFX2G_035926 [Malus domestica]
MKNDGLMSLRRNCTKSICLLHKYTNRKRGQTAFANLQSNVKVLKMRKFRHKDRPCAISSSSENYSATMSRLFAIKIVRNSSLGSNCLFHKFTNGKGGKEAPVNLQNNVKVLEIMKL